MIHNAFESHRTKIRTEELMGWNYGRISGRALPLFKYARKNLNRETVKNRNSERKNERKKGKGKNNGNDANEG